MSGFPLKADMLSVSINVRYVPEADIDVCCHSHGGACHEG